MVFWKYKQTQGRAISPQPLGDEMITNEEYLELVNKWEAETNAVIEINDIPYIAWKVNQYKLTMKKNELENQIINANIGRLLKCLSHLECEKLNWSEDGRLIVEVKND